MPATSATRVIATFRILFRSFGRVSEESCAGESSSSGPLRSSVVKGDIGFPLSRALYAPHQPPRANTQSILLRIVAQAGRYPDSAGTRRSRSAKRVHAGYDLQDVSDSAPTSRPAGGAGWGRLEVIMNRILQIALGTTIGILAAILIVVGAGPAWW